MIMKKIIAAVLVLVMTLSCFAICGAEEASYNPDLPGVVAGLLTYMNFGSSGEDTFVSEVDGVNHFSRGFDDLNSAILAIQSGKIIVLSDLPQAVAGYIINRVEGLDWSTEGYFGGSIDMCMAVLKENEELYNKLNNTIVELRNDGTLDQLKEQYVDAYLSNNEEPVPVELPKFEGAETIRIAVCGDLPPIDFIAADGTPAGFNVALLSAIAEKLQVNFELVQINMGARLLALVQGNVDVVFANRKISYERIESDYFASIDSHDELMLTESYFTSPLCNLFLQY